MNQRGIVVIETFAAYVIVSIAGLALAWFVAVGINHCAWGNCRLRADLHEYNHIQTALGHYEPVSNTWSTYGSRLGRLH